MSLFQPFIQRIQFVNEKIQTSSRVPLVFFHGWGFHSGIWNRVAQSLAIDYEIILVDLPGFGRSSFPDDQPYHLTTLLNLLLPFLPPQAVYIGWSLGGIVAMALAHQNPERVVQLITVASSPRFLKDDKTLWPGMTFDTLQQFATRLDLNYERTLQEFIILQLQGSENCKPLMTELKQQLFLHAQPSAKVMKGGLNILCNSDLRQEITEIRCQQLHMWGRLDGIVPSNIAAKFDALMPTAQYKIFDKAGHAPFLSHEAEFLTTLRAFISISS